MENNTGKVIEKSGNFVSPEKWEPCSIGRQLLGTQMQKKITFEDPLCLERHNCCS